MKPCRLCSDPRISPLATWDGERWVSNSRGVLRPTGAFCVTHELLFRAMRTTSYADMGIVQAVEAFCLEHAPLPSKPG